MKVLPPAMRKRMELQSMRVHDYVLEEEKAKASDGGRSFDSMAMAVAARDNPMLRSIHDKAPHKLIDRRERVEIAAIFAQHAKARTPVGAVDWGSHASRRIYVLRHKWWYRLALKLAFVGLLLVAIWEPTATSGMRPPNAHAFPCTVTELVCAAAFALDVLLALRCWRASFFCHGPNVGYALLVLAILLDAMAPPFVAFLSRAADVTTAGWYPFRCSRALRPLLLPFLSKTCAHMVTSIAHTIPSLADLALCILAAVLFYSLLAASLFGADLEARHEQYSRTAAAAAAAAISHAPNNGSAAYSNGSAVEGAAQAALESASTPPPLDLGLFSVKHDGGRPDGHPLGGLHKTVLHLVMLLFTADNYPFILFASYNCDEIACSPYVGVLLFVSFIFFGTITLMSVFVAVLFDVYKRQHGYVVLAERVEQQKALLAAFALLDTSGDGKLDGGEFDELLLTVHPGVSQQSRELAFRLLDKDDDRVLDQKEFLEVSDVLLLRVPIYTEGMPCLSYSWPPARKVVESLAFEVFSTLLIVGYIALLVMMAADIRWSAGAIAWLERADLIFVIIFTVEFGLKVVGLSWAETWADAWNRLDLVVVGLSYVSMGLEAAFESVGSGVASLRALRLLRLLRLLRAMRAFGKISGASVKTRVLVATFSQFGKVVVPMVLILMAISYTYAIVGMETLVDSLDHTTSQAWGTYCDPLCPSFDSLPHGLLTLFQMLIAANWSPVLEEAILVSTYLWGPTLYFLSYITLCHVFMLSLLAALVLEVYAVEMDKAAREDNEDKMQILCDAGISASAAGGAAGGNNGLNNAQVMLSEGVRKRFREFDTDGSGSLAASELRALLSQLGSHPLTDDEFEAALLELDSDNSGLVDYDEFLPWWRLRGLQQVFDKHDADGSGHIDATEFAFVVRELGVALSPKDLEEALNVLDKDGSRSVSFPEFLGWFETFDMQMEFDKFDADRTGALNRREFLGLLSTLGLTLTRKERDKVFSSIDADGSGLVTFNEFHPWFKAVREQTKKFVLQGGGDWEDELFLAKHDNAEVEARQLMRATVERLADELDAGRVPSRRALIEMLCGDDGHSVHSDDGDIELIRS